MVRPARITIACLTGIALCGIFSACGKQQPQKAGTEKQEESKQENREEQFSGSTFARTPDQYAIQTSSGEDTDSPDATVNAETLQPVSAEEAAAQTEIRRGKRSTWKIIGDIPQNSLAGQVLKSAGLPEGKRFVWTPQRVSGDNLTLFRVPDIKLSPDSSLLVFLETLGDSTGPFGSRLILMSTANWQVLNILEFRNRYFEKFEFIPGTTKIAALCRAQKKAGQKPGFACFDLLTGKEERFQQIDPGIGETTFLVDSKRNLIVSHPKRPSLLVLPFENPGKHEIAVAAPNSIATLSADGKELAVLSPKHGELIEIFRTADWLPAATTKITQTTNAAAFQFIPGNQAFFICGDPGHSSSSTLVRTGRTPVLDGICAGRIVFVAGGNKIYHLTTEENQIDVLDGSTGAKLRTIEVNKAKPGFRKSKPGQVTHLFYIPSCNGLAMFDDKGQFFLIPAESENDAKGQYDERAVIFQQQMED